MEQWKTIEAANRYEISDLGRVRSFCSGSARILSPFVQGSGYYQVRIFSSPGVPIRPLVHRLVAKAFIGNPDGLPQVNHKDGNKLNNSASNLEWVTASENLKHSYRSGIHKPSRKEPKGAIAALKEGAPVSHVARRFGMTITTARRLRNRVGASVWKHPNAITRDRAIMVLAHPGSVRECAADLGLSKSTVHEIRSKWRAGIDTLIEDLEG